MGVRVLRDEKQGYSCLYCSTTMWAFGGIFRADEDPDEFLAWLDTFYHKDPRELKDSELESKIYEWKKLTEQEITNQ